MLKDGNKIKRIRQKNAIKKKGKTPAKRSSKVTSGSATAFTANILRPTGGVISPISIAIIATMANW